jgi:transposase
VEEQQPWATYVIAISLYMLVGVWSILVFPFIVGLLRQQKHRCQKCLNYIKEVSIFESLEDNIFQVSFLNFGILVKRKTFLKGLLLVLVVGLMLFIYDTKKTLGTVQDIQLPNEKLTWERFINECAGR